jgi:hypothetical protein
LLATVLVVVAICRRLDQHVEPLLVILFTLTCGTALTEFRPGRIDHHGFQILLFCLMLLALVSTRAKWSHLLLGAVMALSLTIGLDLILLIATILAWLGIQWAVGNDPQALGLRKTAIGIFIASPVLFAANIAPSQWLSVHCDANSIVYLSAMLLCAAIFGSLSFFSNILRLSSARGTIVLRLCCGMLAGTGALAVLWLVFPQCAGGPYGMIDAELDARWLSRVAEAGGLITQLEQSPRLWLSVVANIGVLLIVACVVMWRFQRQKPEYIALFAVFILTLAASFLQYRAMRVGIFVAIPFCVAFTKISWEWLRERWSHPAPAFAQIILIAAMISPPWIALAGFLLPASEATAITQAIAKETDGQSMPDWKKENFHIFCNREDEYRRLANLPSGIVMSDLSSGPALLVFTRHTTIGGPYHRNGQAIRDILDFFASPPTQAKKLADKWRIDYVAFCDQGLKYVDANNGNLLGARIFSGDEPAWLERLSSSGERLKLFRMVKNHSE